MLVVLGYRRVVQPGARERPSARRRRRSASRWCCCRARRSRRSALWRLPAALPLAPGGALGDVDRQALARGVGFNGATLLLLALFAVGTSLLFGVSWLRVMERIGAGVEALDRARTRAPRGRAEDRRIGELHAAEREQVVEQLREDARRASRSSSCRP